MSQLNTLGRRRPLLIAAMSALMALSASQVAAPADASPTKGITYSVDCSRSSSGSGSTTAPWNSLGAVNKHGAFHPGDQILFKRGATCVGSLRPLGSGGTGAPIVLGAYGQAKAKPTIAGNGTKNGTGTVQLYNQAHWTVQDLHITNRTSAKETRAYRAGVMIWNEAGGRLAGVKVQRLTVDHVVSNLTFSGKKDTREFGGIAVVTWPNQKPNSGFDGLRILNNNMNGVGRTGIVVSNHSTTAAADLGVRIAGNRVVRSRGDSIILRGSHGARIDHNTSAFGADLWPCKQCGSITPDTANAGIWPAFSKNTVIEYNEVYGEHKLGGDGVGIDVDMSAENTTVQYNYVHDNEGGGILFCGSENATARFNILENNARSAFVFIGSIPATNTKIYNNTVYMKRGVSARVVHTQGFSGGKKLSFTNNLIYNLDDSGYYVWPMKYTSRSNTYIGVHGIGEPSEYAKEYVDPGLRNPGSGRNGSSTLGGYHPSSPKGDSFGSPIPGSVKKDFFGNTINPKKPPRGAAAR